MCLICRGKAAEIFFETFNVPALYVQVQAILSLSVSQCNSSIGDMGDSGLARVCGGACMGPSSLAAYFDNSGTASDV